MSKLSPLSVTLLSAILNFFSWEVTYCSPNTGSVILQPNHSRAVARSEEKNKQANDTNNLQTQMHVIKTKKLAVEDNATHDEGSGMPKAPCGPETPSDVYCKFNSSSSLHTVTCCNRSDSKHSSYLWVLGRLSGDMQDEGD